MRPDMRTADVVAVWANMSAPPRSTVMMPRLGRGEAAGAASDTDTGAAPASAPVSASAVGPGGGATLSHAVCIARVDLTDAVFARLGMGYGYARLAAPLGLARALVAVARVASHPRRSPRAEFVRLADLPEGPLLRELAERLQAVPWPAWVPAVGFGQYLAMDPACAVRSPRRPPATPELACPLLAARLVSGLRGAVFLRDAAPTLTRLLTLWHGDTPSGSWELWTPRTPRGR